MSRTLGAGLLAHVAGEVLALALMVRVERVDGQVFGFTSHDRDLTYSGLTYLATSAVEASGVRNSLGRQLDTLDVQGLLQSSVLTDSDLLNGLYDGAEVSVFVVNWRSSPITERAILLTGTIGEVSFQDGLWVAEFRPLSTRLTHQLGQLTSPTCRVKEWGDAECAPGGVLASGTNVSAFRHTGRAVTVVTSRYQLTFGASAEATGYFNAGRVYMTSGLNSGLSREVKQHTLSAGAAVIVLQEPFPRAVAVTNTATLEAGCDRTLAICRSRFNNALNHRGEPEIPTTQVALQRGRKG